MLFIKTSTNALISEIFDKNWENVLFILKAYPEEAKSFHTGVTFNGIHTSRLLALHHACTQNPPLNVIKALIRAYPKAVQARDSYYRRLPIHFACLKKASAEVIHELLEAYPGGASITASLGRLPLHYACATGASKEVIDAIVMVYSDSVLHRDINGWLPIHLACLQNVDSSLVARLLELYPESIFVKTKKGNTPALCMNSVPDCSNKAEILSLLENLGEKLNKLHVAIKSSLAPMKLSMFSVEAGVLC